MHEAQPVEQVGGFFCYMLKLPHRLLACTSATSPSCAWLQMLPLIEGCAIHESLRLVGFER